MVWIKLITFCVLFSISIEAQLQPGLIQEYYNVFNNLSNLPLMPHLMETPECRRDCEIYRRDLLRNQMWAAESNLFSECSYKTYDMFDAKGRQSLGILKGNMHQLGNMKQCLSSSTKTSNIEGKFCMLKIHLKPLESNIFMSEIWQNAFNFTMYTSKPYEKTVLPPSDAIMSTLCVPSSCTARDLTVASRKVLSVFNDSSLGFEVHVDDLTEQNCAVEREHENFKISFIYFAKTFIFAMVTIVLFATVIDSVFLQNVQNASNSIMVALLKSFSLHQNCKTLMNVEHAVGSIQSLNGLRCLAYFMLFTWHYTAKFILSVIDRSDNFNQFFQNPATASVIKNAGFALDLLFFLSGISHFYKITKLISQNDKKLILKSMLHKYVRLLIFWIIFFSIQSTSINKNTMHLVYTPIEIKTSIWSILLCYENFHGMQYMFFGPIHTFYTDIQLYFASCILLLVTRRYKNKTKPIFFLAFISLFCRSLVLYFHPDIHSFISYGMSVNQLTNWLNFMLATPFGRLPFYLSGVALGNYLRENPKRNLTVSSCYRKSGWMVALLCSGIALFSYISMDSHYEYNSFDGAVFSFINSFSWVIFLIWIIWYCEMIGKSSGVNRFFAADLFVILNRLSSHFSVLHIFVLYTCLTNTRFLFEFKLSEILGLDYLLLSVLACVFSMLFIHLPLKNTWNNITAKTKKHDKKL